MIIATKAILEDTLKDYIHIDGTEAYINEEDVGSITNMVLHSYSNVYCFSNVGSDGRTIFTINSTRKHKEFIKVYVRRTQHEGI